MNRMNDSCPFPKDAVLVTAVTEEDRCAGALSRMKERPVHTIVIWYTDQNQRRDHHLQSISDLLKRRDWEFSFIECDETIPADCIRTQTSALKRFVVDEQLPIILDISVFTKRNLLMLWKWLDDVGAWDRVTVVYSEPRSYVASRYIPLTFGLESLQQIPGFAGVPDCSRPVHLVLLLGYEGDRALSVYELIQPMQTTLFIPHPPYRPEWQGLIEEFNQDVLNLAGREHAKRVDPLNSGATESALREVIGTAERRGAHAVVICPLGTKPQTLGVFEYLRGAKDPAAIIYANPLRHNRTFYSEGIGDSWVVKEGA